MQIDVFKYKFREVTAVLIGKDYALFRKPLRLVNLATGNKKRFAQLDDALKAKVEGMTVAEHIEALTALTPPLNGGRGSSSGMGGDGDGEGEEEQQTFSFGHAPDGNGNGSNGTPDLPARLNVRVPNTDKSPERALEEFRKLHALSNTEFGVTVDEYGFITQYVRGDATSVAIMPRRGEMVYHNHPSGGAFSDSDLLSAAMTGGKGIVASGKNGDYIFAKTNHFKPEEFARAVRGARMKGKNYDDAVDKWLTRNQKKFGYSYVFKLASDRS